MAANLHIARTLLYLRVTSFANFIRVGVKRLRQPRYLIGGVAVLGYMWMLFLRPARGPSDAFNGSSPFADSIPALAAAVVFLMVWVQWLLSSDKPGLRFTEAEIAFLFPAPVTRRQLIHYRLLDNLVSTLLSALIFMLIFNGVRLGFADALRSWGAWWCAQAILGVHGIAVTLVTNRLSNRGWSSGLRRTVVAGIGILYLGSLVALQVTGRQETAVLLLWPWQLLIAPFFAEAGGYLLALIPALAVLALHYAWVLRLETPFEEASMDQAHKLAERLANYRAGKGLRLMGKRKAKNESFTLLAKFPVEIALLWKNLMVAPAYMNRRVFFIVALIFVAATWWLQQQDLGRARAALGAIPIVLLGYLFAFGPQLATNDLRGELVNMDIVKTWPQPGWRIVLGSLLAPMLQLSSIGVLFLLVIVLNFRLPPEAVFTITPALRIIAGVGVALMLPLMFGLQLLVPNAFLLTFPAWGAALRPGPGRFDVAGLRLLFFAAQLLFVVISLLPPFIVGSIVWFFCQGWFSPHVAVVLVLIPVLFVLTLEFLYGVYLLGERFDRADLVAETR